MSKWKIDKKNVQIDSAQVDLESAIKKAKWLRIINIICYICTAILFVFFVIGGVRSCTHKKSSSSNTTPQAQRVVVRVDNGSNYFTLQQSDFENEEFYDEFLYSLQDVGEVIYEVDGGEESIGTLYTINDSYEIVSLSTVFLNNNTCVQFADTNEDTHIWYFSDGIAVISSSADAYDTEGLSFGFSVDNDYLKDNFYEVFEVLDNFYVGYDESIFDAITDTVSNFTITLGLGITSILALFYANSQLTVLGTITVIVVGVALVYFLMRFIFGLIRLRG